MDRRRFINLLAAIAAITVFGFTFGLMFPLLSLIMESRGIAPQWIGYNAAMHPAGIVLSVFAIPYVVSRFGAKKAVIGAGLVTASVIVSYPFFPVFWWWFGFRVMQGFFVSILFAISEAWIVRFSEGAWRSRILALYTSILALSFGGGPAIIGLTGIEGALPFFVGAAVLLFAILPIFFVKDEEVDSEDETPLSVIAFARKEPVLLFAVGMFAILDAANLSFLPVYAVKKGFDQDMAALALTAFVLGNTVLQFPIGWCADHFPKRWVMVGCGVLSGTGSFLVPFVFGTWALWPVLTVMGATAAGIYTVALAELGERFSGHELVTGTASFSTMWGLGALVGSLAAGWSIAGFGPDGLPFTMAAVFMVFVASATVSAIRVRRPAR
ncbi:MFS transporter [Aestuariivirga sp.]|uniref:MFS transporter n=1 Tax=Aestuariivirga sp. TaxID=2650926 RepID=UPI0025C595A7|nr:MFS transporter [Aestuariivirga sp.]MCA3556227.1 MFS transporter [Aestuariivirga sp.]